MTIFYIVIIFTVIITVIFSASVIIFTIIIIINITIFGNLRGHKYFWNDVKYLPCGKNAKR